MLCKVICRQHISSMCAVCGVDNPASLGAKFYHVDAGDKGSLMVGLVSGRDVHQSYPGRMHGGLIGALLDEVIGRAINIPEPDGFGVTTEMQLKYIKPVPLDEEIKVVGKLVRNTRLMYIAEGFIEDAAGTLLATGRAVYMKMPVSRISDVALDEKNWFLFDDAVREIYIANLAYFDVTHER